MSSNFVHQKSDKMAYADSAETDKTGPILFAFLLSILESKI